MHPKLIEKKLNIPFFSDIVLEVGETRYYCHKYILSFNSEYFKELFNVNANSSIVKIDDDHHDTVIEQLILCIYTGTIDLPGDSELLFPLIVSADFFGILEAKTQAFQKCFCRYGNRNPAAKDYTLEIKNYETFRMIDLIDYMDNDTLREALRLVFKSLDAARGQYIPGKLMDESEIVMLPDRILLWFGHFISQKLGISSMIIKEKFFELYIKGTINKDNIETYKKYVSGSWYPEPKDYENVLALMDRCVI